MANWATSTVSKIGEWAPKIGEWAGSSVVDNLVSTAYSHLRICILPADTEADLKKLQTTLPQIKAVMGIAEALLMKDPNASLWVDQFRKAVEASEVVLKELENKERDDAGGSASSSKKRKRCSINGDTLKRLKEAVTMLDRAADSVKPLLQAATLRGIRDISESQQKAGKSLRRETSCFLAETERDGKMIEVASEAINVPANCEETVHLRSLPSDHARVMVDEVVPGEEDTPLPVPHEDMPTIISAVGSSTAWPMDMISIDQEPHKVHTGGDVVQTGADMFDGIDFGSFPQSYTLLRDRFLSQPNNAFYVNPPPDLFHTEEPLVVRADDFLTLVKPKEWLTAPIIQIFMMYMQKYNKEEHREDERVGFMDPLKTNFLLLNDDAQSKEYIEAYINEALRRNRNKKLIFIPYHQLEHWLLVVLMPRESQVYVFNSSNVHCSGKTVGKKSVPHNPKIIDALKMPYQLDQMIRGIGKCSNLKVTYCRCPQQTGGWECGYYVMMIVHDIIHRFLRNFPKMKDFPTRYPNYKMDEIRNLWCNFFLKEILIQKSKTI